MWTPLMTLVMHRLRKEEGQTSVEYALVIALVCILIAGALATFGSDVFSAFWNNVKNELT